MTHVKDAITAVKTAADLLTLVQDLHTETEPAAVSSRQSELCRDAMEQLDEAIHNFNMVTIKARQEYNAV